MMVCSLMKNLMGEEYSYNKWEYCNYGPDIIPGLFEKLISAINVAVVLPTFSCKHLITTLLGNTANILLKNTPRWGLDAYLIDIEY